MENLSKDNLISIIIPVYNVEQQLDTCVESVVGQTYKNIEIILVDDGSKDSSGKICDSWKEEDNRIVVIHQENGGLSAARNKGLDNATGEYVFFLDSDDWLAKETIESLFSTIKKENADLAICGLLKDTDGKIEEICPEDEVLSSLQAQHKLYDEDGWKYVIACAKLYDKKIFNDLRFIEGRIHEDEFIVHKVFDKCKKIVTLKKPFYHYIIRNNSITKSKITIKRLDAIDSLLDRYSFYKEKDLEELIKPLLTEFAYMYADIISKFVPKNDEEKQRLDETKNKVKEIFKAETKITSKKEKLMINNPRVWKTLSNIKHRENT